MNEVDKLHLLDLARDSIDSYFSDEKPDTNEVSHIEDEKAVFIELRKRGDLRGGMGSLEKKQIPEAVIETARKAAFEDPRFDPVKESETSSIKIRISVLGKKEILVGEVEDYDEQIEIGKHGLLMEGAGKAIILPYIAKDRMYTPIQFLNALSQKAGLSFNSWKDDKNRIYRFEGETFSE